jgi:hypothetical protein
MLPLADDATDVHDRVAEEMIDQRTPVLTLRKRWPPFAAATSWEPSSEDAIATQD